MIVTLKLDEKKFEHDRGNVAKKILKLSPDEVKHIVYGLKTKKGYCWFYEQCTEEEFVKYNKNSAFVFAVHRNPDGSVND